MFEMFDEDVYGVVKVPVIVFQQLNQEFFISGCTDSVKYMCANNKERIYLESLGIVTTVCDYFKIILEN